MKKRILVFTALAVLVASILLTTACARIELTTDKTLTLEEGASKKLAYTLKGSNEAVAWTSSETDVATVTADGTVTAVKEGTAIITAKVKGASAMCTVTVLESLSAAKERAKDELEDYKDADDYRADQQAAIESAVAAGKLAIDQATSKEEVESALAAAKALIDEIKTDETLSGEELAAAKTEAKNELSEYKNPENYRDEQKTALENIIAAAGVAIDGASNKAEIDTALAAAKTLIDALKTSSQLEDEELAAAKAAAKNELAEYADSNDYSDNNWEIIQGHISDGEQAIDDAGTAAAVESALADAKEAIDAVEKGCLVRFENEFGEETETRVNKGETLSEEDRTVSHSGYEFDGWRTGNRDGALWDFENTVTSDLTLTARWVEIKSITEATVTNTVSIPNVQLDFADSKARVTFSGEVDFDAIADIPNISQGENPLRAYLGLRFDAPEEIRDDAHYTSVNKKEFTSAGEATEWTWRIAVAEREDEESPYAPLAPYSKTDTFYFFDEDKKLIGVYTLESELTEYTFGQEPQETRAADRATKR